jgi:protein gp37
MSDKTIISWTKATWNPWHGCTKVSEGCDNCYMFTAKRRYGQDPEKVVRSKTKFRDPLKWKDPTVIFTCSWSDFFHKDADAWREEAWEIIRATPHHTYQILTKRPGRMFRHLPLDWGDGYPNVWLGTTIENQDQMHRAWRLGDTPARVRFISAEPLLSRLSFINANGQNALERIDWVICGGESGPGFREMDLAWAFDVLAQCRQ